MPTILSLSMVTVMSGAAVAPALGKIANAFSETDPTLIKMILTLPAVFIIIFSLVSGWLSIHYPKRVILGCGLFLYLIGGIGGGFAKSIEHLLLSRAILGVGVGLIMPLSVGLIAYFYTGEEHTKMMGYSAAASNFGGIVATLTAGLVAELSWRYSFSVYVYGFTALLLVLLFLPEPEPKKDGTKKSVKLPKTVYGWAGGSFLLAIAFFAIPVNLALFLEQNNLGGASSAGLGFSVMSACGFFAGLSFASVQSLVKSFFPVLLFIIMTLGYFFLSQADNFTTVLLAIAIFGLGFGWMMSLLYVGATKAGGEGVGAQAMAVVSSMTFLGQFMSPIILNLIGRMLGDTSSRFTFVIISICYGALLFISLLRWSLSQWKRLPTFTQT